MAPEPAVPAPEVEHHATHASAADPVTPARRERPPVLMAQVRLIDGTPPEPTRIDEPVLNVPTGPGLGEVFKDGDPSRSLRGVQGPGSSWASGRGHRASGAIGTLGPGTAPQPEQGTVDRDGVRRVMASLTEELLACFEGRQGIEPMPDGHLEVVFTITPSGVVGGATVTQSLRRDVDGCVEELVRGQLFPKPTGGKVRVGPYRIVFERISKGEG